jgi:dihydrofolate synthase / folylpolyglutamate synthase
VALGAHPSQPAVMRAGSSGRDRDAGTPGAWTEAKAEGRLRALELFGMRFGLERMRRMMTALDSPQRRFDAIHVLGTNGKSSTTRMIAAILERHGVRTGAYTSPHLVSYRERLQIAEHDLAPDAFAAAVARALHAAEQVNRTLAEDDHVTQFELLTAAAFWEMARCEVAVGVVEAGLGGRFDATSVLDAPITVLTNVGLEHTRWLGPTIADIAEEKLAVVAPGGTLVLGEGLAVEARAIAERVAGERDATIVWAGAREEAQGGQASPQPLARGRFQRANLAVARSSARVWLERGGMQLDERAVAEAAATTAIPGRLQVLDGEPLTVLDGVHNPHAVAALTETLTEVVGDRELALVMGVLEDKDAAGMLEALLGVCEQAYFTAPPSPRALSPAALQSLARQLGFDDSVCEPRPAQALAQAREWAAGGGGRERAILVTGSVYLVGAVLAQLTSGGPAR